MTEPRPDPLTGTREWCWYLVAGASYIAVGIWQKWLLNWLLGPIWLVAVICLGPAVTGWITNTVRLIGRSR